MITNYLNFFPPNLRNISMSCFALLVFSIVSISQIYPHIMHYGKVDSSTNCLKFPLSRPCNAGEQCFLSYGKFSSSHLIIFYGFLPQADNPYDVIPLGNSLALFHLSAYYFSRAYWLCVWILQVLTACVYMLYFVYTCMYIDLQFRHRFIWLHFDSVYNIISSSSIYCRYRCSRHWWFGKWKPDV